MPQSARKPARNRFWRLVTQLLGLGLFREDSAMTPTTPGWAPGVLAPIPTHVLPSPCRARRAPITPTSSPDLSDRYFQEPAALLQAVSYAFRRDFLIRPFIIALTLGAAGAVFSWLEEDVPGVSSLV